MGIKIPAVLEALSNKGDILSLSQSIKPVEALLIQEGSLKARKVNDEVANGYPSASFNLPGNGVSPE
ncbi:hypothetical protein HG530_014814 [Fusarium avenaceum]|nr:hypothetical protein HG530_014814 [Fusarium avenaceum]